MEGSDGHFLFVRPGWISWSIWSSLKAEKVYIDSGSAGHACPAHPRNAPNLMQGSEEWKFYKATGSGFDWKEGGVAIKCAVHDDNSHKLQMLSSYIFSENGLISDVCDSMEVAFSSIFNRLESIDLE